MADDQQKQTLTRWPKVNWPLWENSIGDTAQTIHSGPWLRKVKVAGGEHFSFSHRGYSPTFRSVSEYRMFHGLRSLTTVSSPIQTSCGLWGRYTVSPSATWPWKECLTTGGGLGSLTPARGTSWQTAVTKWTKDRKEKKLEKGKQETWHQEIRVLPALPHKILSSCWLRHIVSHTVCLCKSTWCAVQWNDEW